MNKRRKSRKWQTGARCAALLSASAVLGGVALATPPPPRHHQQVEQIEEGLTAPQKETLSRLESLNEFSDDQWRTHPGDLAHGESPDISDASWTVAKPGDESSADTTWYRSVVTIPPTINGYSTTGMRVSIQFRIRTQDREDAPMILYFDGRRVALGADLEPEVLTESAKPGEKILVAMKLLATDKTKTFEGAAFRLEFPESRPSPEDFRMEALSASALIPTLSKNKTADEATLQKAIDTVNVKALDTAGIAGQHRFDASLKAATEQLASLRPMLQTASFHETGNSHIDAAWLWPRSETIDVVHRTFSTAAQLLHEYPKYTYTQSAAQYNEWMADKYPDLNDEIKKQIKAGRWEVVGGMWVEPDLNMPSGEATARSILLGKRWYQKHYGVDVHIGWNPDTFGYNWQLPQIYAKSGIDTFVTQKMSWNDTNQLPLKLFWWESPDGSKVLTYFPHDYGNRSLDPVRLSTDLADARKKSPGIANIMDLYGVGDHGGGPTRAMLDQGMHWATPDKIAPKMEFGTADSFFQDVRPKVAPESKTWDYKSIAQGYTYPAQPTQDGQIDIPTWKDELYLEFHRGVFTTQTGHKYGMRSTESATLTAEKFASLAWLDGDSYPNAPLTDAWEKITFNGFHDLAAGSGIGVIYRDSHKDFTEAKREDGDVIRKASGTIDARINTAVKNGVPLLVWNTLAWKRGGLVTANVQFPNDASGISVYDAQDKALPVQVLSSNASTHTYRVLINVPDVPSLGYTLLHAVPTTKEVSTDLKASGLTLENAKLRVTVDPQTGCITSLYNKADNFETLASGACGNELQAFHDNPKEYDAWNIDPGTYDVKPELIDTASSVKLVEQSPVRDTIEIHRQWGKSTFTQRISLAADADHAVVDNMFDWHESHILLKAAFPLAATNTYATYEIPYGSIQRPTTRNNSWEKARFEVPALRWADEGDGQHGFSLINDSKYGYDGVGNLLRLTLLRSPKSPDADADMGMQHFQYSLFPHAGTWAEAGTVHHGRDFDYPLEAMQVAAHTGELPTSHSFVDVSSPDVILTAVKKAEDSDALIFRMYESAGKGGPVTLTVPKGATGAEVVNIMEKPMNQSVSVDGDKLQLTIKPWEILTVAVNYPHTNTDTMTQQADAQQ